MYKKLMIKSFGFPVYSRNHDLTHRGENNKVFENVCDKLTLAGNKIFFFLLHLM